MCTVQPYTVRFIHYEEFINDTQKLLLMDYTNRKFPTFACPREHRFLWFRWREYYTIRAYMKEFDTEFYEKYAILIPRGGHPILTVEDMLRVVRRNAPSMMGNNLISMQP